MTAFYHVLTGLILVMLMPFSGFLRGDHPQPVTPYVSPPIRIGMLIPDENFREPVDAARMAIERINATGGLKGRTLELVVRTTEGPWGAGSKESVALVYEDSVVAMLTFLDSRNDHLAEQVAAKSHLICLSTYATDPTLTQAYVPWFLRVVPSDDQQSAAILSHIYGEPSPDSNSAKPHPGRTGIIAVDNNDSWLAAGSFVRIAKRMGFDRPEVFPAGEKQSLLQLTKWIGEHEIRQLVVTSLHPGMMEMIEGLDTDIVLYGTHMFASGLDAETVGRKPFSRMILVSIDVLSGSSAARFREEFTGRYGYTPRLTAYYAHDAASLLLEGISLFGADREALKLRLPGIRYREGITGPITFDKLGNRNDAVRLSTSNIQPK